MRYWMMSNRKSDYLQTTVSVTGQSRTSKIVNNSKRISIKSWAKKWYMRLEPSKCKMMRITGKTTHKITYQYTTR